MSPKLRVRILERDGYRCVYCGRTSKDAMLEVDHITPRSRGGGNEPTNLITSCDTCNQGKSADRLTLPSHADPRMLDLLRPRVRLAPGRVFDPRFDHYRPFEYRCDGCGDLAETVRFLPTIPAERVLFACGGCDPGGETWPVVDLFSGAFDPSLGRADTGIDALLRVDGGDRTAALLRVALRRAAYPDRRSVRRPA